MIHHLSDQCVKSHTLNVVATVCFSIGVLHRWGQVLLNSYYSSFQVTWLSTCGPQRKEVDRRFAMANRDGRESGGKLY